MCEYQRQGCRGGLLFTEGRYESEKMRVKNQ